MSAETAASGEDLILSVEYDDGMIVWINGVEVERCRMGPPRMQIFHEQTSLLAGRTIGNPETLTLGSTNDLLVSGANVIAVQVQNASLSSNLFFDGSLSAATAGTIIDKEGTWDYFPGHLEPSGGIYEPYFLPQEYSSVNQWTTVDFGEASWSTGVGPLGYDTTSDNTLGTNLIREMRFISTSLYMRQRFAMSETEVSETNSVLLTVEYDDGFIAYLNGVEIARRNLASPGSFIDHTTATGGDDNDSLDGGGNSPALIATFPVNKSLLVPGENVLSAQLHNSRLDSNDLLLDMKLESIGTGTTTLAPSDGEYHYFIGTSEPSLPPIIESTIPTPEFSDWFELHNTGTEAVDLTGWSVSDDSAVPNKFILPEGTSISADGYLLILADNHDIFNGRTVFVHASFKLAADGEYLALYDADGLLVDSLSPKFPQQRVFQTYGREPTGQTFGYLDRPTPGAVNTGTFYLGVVDAPDFSVSGGFYHNSVTTNLTSETPGATILYSTDGTEPTENTGLLYAAPLVLDEIDEKTGHCIRARAFKSGYLPSEVTTHTFLINQNANLRLAPTLIMSGDEEEVFYHPNGILAIEGGAYANGVWYPQGKDAYNVPVNRGRSYERSGYLEYFDRDGDGFRKAAGFRFAGSRDTRERMVLDDLEASPFPIHPFRKPSFNIWIRDEYGDDHIDFPWLGESYQAQRFRQFRARAGKNDDRNPFVKDELMRRLYHEMGQESALGVINTLYINGKFKGYYNLCERLREPFMQEHHDSDLDWDVRQISAVASGDSAAWNEMRSRLAQDLNVEANWKAALGYFDPVALADYYLLNIYGATWDWPNNNWVAARERSPEGKFRFYVWDAEGAFGTNGNKPTNYNVITKDLLGRSGESPRIFQRLHQSAEWRLIFADRIHRHLFHNGTLDDREPTISPVHNSKEALASEYGPLLDFVFHVPVHTEWFDTWVDPASGRRAYLLGPEDEHFRENGLWPLTEPPTFNEHGGVFVDGFTLSISARGPGTIYYTLDGTDPRTFGGSINTSAAIYSAGVSLTGSAVIAKARVRSEEGEWSALTEAVFSVGAVPASSSNLALVELMYHPAAPSQNEIDAGHTDRNSFEFVRLQNVGTSTIDLHGVRFDQGITFDFSEIDGLEPGMSVLVVRNLVAFRHRYGTDFDSMIAGAYSGALSNSGELIRLKDATGKLILSFTYEDSGSWPALSDGVGLSLQIIDPTGEPGNPSNWRTSSQYGGNPNGLVTAQDFASWRSQHFSADELNDTLVSGPDADPDGDGLSNLFEYGIGILPRTKHHHLGLPEGTIVEIDGAAYLAMEYGIWSGASRIDYTVEVSGDLTDDWRSGNDSTEVVFGPIENSDGTMTMKVRDLISVTEGRRRFIRLRVSTQ